MDLSTYISLFPAASREKARFMALAEAVLRQVMDLQSVVADINSAFSFSGAAGAQLDAFGETLGIHRADLGENVA